jgi:hypothetical protein
VNGPSSSARLRCAFARAAHSLIKWRSSALAPPPHHRLPRPPRQHPCATLVARTWGLEPPAVRTGTCRRRMGPRSPCKACAEAGREAVAVIRPAPSSRCCCVREREESSELRETEIRLDVGAQVVVPRTHRKPHLLVTQAKASLSRIVMA